MALVFFLTTLFLYLVGGFLFNRTAFRIAKFSDEDGVFLVRTGLPPLKWHVALWFIMVPYWELTGQTEQGDSDEPR